jgi:two-component system, sensor histidine kinase PdtaS
MGKPMPLPNETVTTLATALVTSSKAPLLLLDEKAIVVGASTSFCNAFNLDPSTIANRRLADLGAGEWDVPQLNSLLLATIAGAADIDAYEMDLVRQDKATRRLILSAHKLDYFDTEKVRIVLAATDVTPARLAEKQKDDLVREKQVLLQELQHRVANSLQIIASVLMQSARRVQSEETRLHLQDAHSRVMSIAMLQKQLAVTQLKSVELRAYFRDLCRSISASMIDEAIIYLRKHMEELTNPDGYEPANVTQKMVVAGASVLRMASASADFFCEAEEVARDVIAAALEAQSCSR